MEERLAEEIRRRLVLEKERKSAPKNFPVLPDIPVGRYLDPQLYELEIDHVWRKTWLYAAHASELKQVGSYKLVDLGFTDVLLMKGEDGVVRAFLNVCRHRGSPLLIHERVQPRTSLQTLNEGPSERYSTCGVSKRLTCFYHQWSYDNSGRCAHVMDERDFVGLKKEDRSLFSVRCEAAGNFYFVNLDDNAEPLKDFLRPVWPYIYQIYEADLVHHYTTVTDLDINWKLLLDATLEFYHGKSIHPTLAKFCDFEAVSIQLYDRGHCSLTVGYDRERMARSRRDSGWKVGDRIPEGIQRIPGANKIFHESLPNFFLFPNNEMALEASSFAFFQTFPLGPKKSRMQLDHFSTPWGDGPRPRALDERIMTIERVNVEDVDNHVWLQESIEDAYRNGKRFGFPMAYQERRIYHVQNWIDRMIGPDKIRPELRVPNVLEQWIERR
jgi:phenylpropionate dioxygenase-like ring-hydroxylating dioxygenase large terminal subunit